MRHGLVFAVCLWAGGIEAVGAEAPSAFYLQPYVQRPTPTAMTVMWETSDVSVGAVEYGLTPALGRSVAEKGLAKIHAVRLEGLVPRTRYHYRVKVGNQVSETASFRTAPPAGTTHWRMALYGDSRSNPQKHEAVTRMMLAHEPDVVIHSGDIVARGTVYEQWKQQHFDPARMLLARLPLMPSLGNHEQNAGHYFKYFDLPGNERYYSFDYGNAHLIALDSNGTVDVSPDGEQARWLVRDLATHRSAKWCFVYFHHPLFSGHATRPVNPLRWNWAPLFEELGLDGVLTGHDHFYARSYPVGRLGDGPTRGVLHLTSGGGGASLYKTKDHSWVEARKEINNAVIFDFRGDEVDVRALDMEGNTFDQFTLTKGVTPAERFCAYEVYELERDLNEQAAAGETVRVAGGETVRVARSVEVAHQFAVRVKARLTWDDLGGWKSESGLDLVLLEPGKPLRFSFELERAAPGAAEAGGAPPALVAPTLRVQFDDHRFRNRTLLFKPFRVQADKPEAAKAEKKADTPKAEKKVETPKSETKAGAAKSK